MNVFTDCDWRHWKTVDEVWRKIGLVKIDDTLMDGQITHLDNADTSGPLREIGDDTTAEMMTLVEPGAVVQEAVTVPMESEVRMEEPDLWEITLEEFSSGAGVVQDEVARVIRGPELRESHGVRRNVTGAANILEERQRRIIKHRNSAARSREVKQSMAVTMRPDDDNLQRLNLGKKDMGTANQIAAAMCSPGLGSSGFGDNIGSSQTSGVKQPHSSNKQSIKENGRAKQNVEAPSLSWVEFLQTIPLQPDSLSQHLISEVVDINRANVVCTEPDGTNVTKKQSMVWTLDREYRISRNVLEQHSGKKLKDVAEIHGGICVTVLYPAAISRSTLKRICRKHHIFRWPPCKAKNSKCSSTRQEFVQTGQENVKESTQRNQPLYNPTQEKYSVSNAETTSNATELLGDSRIMVKATPKDDIIKFQISVSPRKWDLEEEVAARLRLSVGSFKIKYLDEDDDWILITCDTDLRTCISTSGSIKMLVG